MEEKMSNNEKISRNQNQNQKPKQNQHQHNYTYLNSAEDQKLQIFSSPLPRKEVLIGTPGIMTRLSRVLFPEAEAEADVKEAPISNLEHHVHVRRPARVSMGDRTTTKQQSHAYDSLAMLGAPCALGSGSGPACVSIKSKKTRSKSLSSRKERGGKKGKQQQQQQTKSSERKSREHRDRGGSRTSSSTKNRSRRGRSLDSSSIRRQSLANITNHCNVSEKKRKSRRRKSESSRRVSGMDILGNLESLHDIVNQQSDRLKASTRKKKKQKKKAKLKKDRKRTENTITNICTGKNSSAKENLNPKSKGPVPARRALSTVTTSFENLPSANNNISSIVSPLVPEPYLPLVQTKCGPKSDVRKNHNTVLNSLPPPTNNGKGSIEKDGDSSASFSDNVVASSTDEVLISPTISTHSDAKNSQSTIHMSPPKSESTNSTTIGGHSSILADENAVEFHNDEELMSPTIAPRASKRADTKATPMHLKILNEKENTEPIPSSNHAQKQKFVNNALLSPSVRPKSTKRVDTKRTPTQNHACQDTRKIAIQKSKDETSISILKKDSKYPGEDEEAPTKVDANGSNNVGNKNRFMSPSIPFVGTIDCHSCPKEIFVDLSKMKQDFDLKDDILDLSISPLQPNIFDENGIEKESATKSVIRRSSRKQTPVNRLVATFKRKRKRGAKKVEKGKSTKKTEILDKGNTTSYKSPALKKTPKKESMTESKEPKSEATRRSSRLYRPVDRLSLSFKKQRKTKKVRQVEKKVRQVEKKVKQVEKKVKQVEKEVPARSTTMISVKESNSSKIQACKEGILLKSSRVSKPPERLTMKHQKRIRRLNNNAVTKEKHIEIERAENAKKNTEPEICDLKICVEDEDSSKRRSSRTSKSIVRFKPTFANTHTRLYKSKRKSKKIKKEKVEKSKEKENDVIETCEPTEEKLIKSEIPKDNYIGLLTKGKRFGDKCIDSPEKFSGWNSANIQNLKIAHAEAEPTSHLFWQTIAQKVPGKNAEDCHLKWFAMFASPLRQKKSVKNVPAVTDAQVDVDVSDDASTDDEDDIFDSTPVRNGSQLFSAFLGSSTPSSLRKSSAQSLAQFSDMFSSPLLLKKKSCAKKIEGIDGASPFTLRNQSKLYMKELKAGIGEKMRVFEPKKKSLEKKGSNEIFESIEDGDMQLGGALSPGGTLRIESPDDDDLEQMYSDSNLSISSEMD